MVRKGLVEDSEHYQWIQEVKSFKRRQEVPGKHFWMSEVLEVSKNIQKPWNGAGRLQMFRMV